MGYWGPEFSVTANFLWTMTG